MAIFTRELRASYAFVERNFNLTRRYWGWEVAFLVYAVAGALSITLIGKEQGDVVEVQVPGGVRSYEILEIRYV